LLEVLNAHYRKLERLYQPVRDPNYEHLVIATDNTDESVHRWFRMKEAFSTRLFVRLLKDLQLNDNEFLRILDPFAGSGTTLVSALTWAGENGRQVYAHGTEVNPFLHLLSSAKAEALSLELDLRSDLARSVERSAVAVLAHTDPIGKPPDLAAFHDTRYFEPSIVERLLRIRAGIDRLPNDLTAKILRVALAAVVEPASRLRRDGRALRYVPSKTVMEPRAAFARAVGRIALDLRLSVSAGHATAELRDALRPESAVASRAYDLAIFSPPYPNNIDYTEVYKLEAWLLGLIANQNEFRAQRFRTMRSHPSISWPVQQDCLPARLQEQVLLLANPLLEAVPAPGSKNGLALLARLKRLRPGSRLVLFSGFLDTDQRESIEALPFVDRAYPKGVDLVQNLVTEAQEATMRGERPTDWVSLATAYRASADTDIQAVESLELRLRGGGIQ
jgi:hypothetical protein